jgi:ABC-2 type transport system ATP-binding protein
MPAVSFQNVSKNYATPRGELQALKGVSFDIQAGEFFGLLGPNGAGKTTLISILAGLSRASGGHVRVHGHDVVSDFAAARRQLGVVPQELVFDPFFNVRETLRIQSGYFGIKGNDAWIDELLEGLGLADKAGANMRQLSGGMKRRVLVAQALVHKPPVIVLDEPTAGVDVELRQTLWQFVSQLNKTQGSTVLLRPRRCVDASPCSKRVRWWRSKKPPTCSAGPRPTSCASKPTTACQLTSRPWPVSPAGWCSCLPTTRPRWSASWPACARLGWRWTTSRSARPTWKTCSWT